IADGDEAETAREIAALEQADPSLARAYQQIARFALERFGRDTQWLERILAAGEAAPLRRPSRARRGSAL
ncbi:MAG: hypothetical protein ACP5U2_14730, partial [Bryobacteraceae bacterium]